MPATRFRAASAGSPIRTIDRRRACAGILAAGLGLTAPLTAGSQAVREETDATESAAVEALGRKAGLGKLGKDLSPHFLAIGDAPDGFRQSALRHCEALGDDFLKHFKDRGFGLELPRGRLTIVVLKDVTSYEAMLGEAPGKDVGGHFDLETNRLVIFDFRPGKDVPAAAAERLNLFTLVHETAHQLSFNSGLFRSTASPPSCVSEGLATYVELWKPGVRNAIGRINEPRLRAVREADDWIPIADLLAEDRLLQGAREQLAYAESWLLVHHLLRSKTQGARFREYLDGLRPGGKQDVALAEKHLGPLGRLDRTIKDEARKYLRG